MARPALRILVLFWHAKNVTPWLPTPVTNARKHYAEKQGHNLVRFVTSCACHKINQPSIRDRKAANES